MDNVIHTLAGLVLRDATPRKLFESRVFLWIALIVANLPDIDLITFLINPAVFFQIHRGVTHSLFMAPIWGLFGAIAAYYLSRKKLPFFRVWFWYFLAVVCHLFLDFITSYGIELFAPFSNKTYSAHLFPTVDLWTLVLLIILITLILISKRGAVLRRFVIIGGAVVFLIYAGIRVGAKISAENRVIAHYSRPDRIYSFADIESWEKWLNPTAYRVVTVNGDSAVSYEVICRQIVEQKRFDLFNRGDKFWNEAVSYPLSREFIERCVLPVTYRDNYRLLISDLRYSYKIGYLGSFTVEFSIKGNRITGQPKMAKPKLDF